mgnify:CR=1 FL=1
MHGMGNIVVLQPATGCAHTARGTFVPRLGASALCDAAIAVSHPHFYAACADWAEAFSAHRECKVGWGEG